MKKCRISDGRPLIHISKDNSYNEAEILDCDFKNITKVINGGNERDIFLDLNKGYIKNCTFTNISNNHSSSSYKGIISAENATLVEKCIFTNCDKKNEIAPHSSQSKLMFEECKFN